MRLIVRSLGLTDYVPVWEAMRVFTDSRQKSTLDEIWVTEHKRVFTQGQSGRPENIIDPGDIPVVLSDRGGQLTYPGPGQLVAARLRNGLSRPGSVRVPRLCLISSAL